MRNTKTLIVAAQATLVLIAASCWAADVPQKTVLSFHSAETWDGGHVGLQLDTLEIIELTCPQEVRRLLVSQRNGGRIVIDRIFEPPRGRTQIRLMSDAGNWMITLVDETDRRIAINGIGDYGGQILWRQRDQQDGSWTLTRSVSLNGQKLGEVTSALQDMVIGAQLREILSESNRLTTIASSMPPKTAELVLLLESLASSEKGRGTPLANLSPLLGLIGEALRSHGQAGDGVLRRAQWAQTPKGGGAGVELIHGELRDFLAQFKSIASTRDPLGELRGPAGGGCPAKVVGE